MKSFAIAVALLASNAAADTCDASMLTPLLTNPNIQQCSSDSGYAFTAASIPTQDIINKMCASSACLNLLADAQTMNLTECTLPVGDNINLMADLIDYVPPRCPSGSAGSAATTINVGSSSGASTETVTVPSTTTSSTDSVASSAASASAAASASGSSAASSVASAIGAASVAAITVGAYFL